MKYDNWKYLKAVHSANGPANHRTRSVLTILALHRNKDTGKCCPGTRLIAEEADMQRNTAIAHLDDGVALGWTIRHVMKTGGTSGAYTQYDLFIGKRVSQASPLDQEESGSIPIAKRVNSGLERVNLDDQAGQPWGSPEQKEQKEQREQRHDGRTRPQGATEPPAEPIPDGMAPCPRCTLPLLPGSECPTCARDEPAFNPFPAKLDKSLETATGGES